MAGRTRHATSTPKERDRSTCLGETTAEPGQLRSSYRLLMMRGLSPTEAGNIVAWLAGLHPAETGWSVAQIDRLVALRSFVACGVIAS